MHAQRTGGMTAIGILNIVFGSIGSLLSLLVVVGGGIFAAVGSAGAAGEGQSSSGAGEMIAAGGMMVMGMGLLMLLCNVLLVASGVGVLKLASWGRMLAMICGGAMSVLGILSMIGGDIGVMTLFMIGYGGTLVGLFMKPDWKAAFVPMTTPTGALQSPHAVQQPRMRDAA